VEPGSTLAAAALACSFAVESIAVTRSSLRRPSAALALHCLAFAAVALTFVAVTGRPLFSVCVTLVLIALLAVVGNAKYESLREPLVFTDLSLFSQVFSHPRLYLPFLGAAKIAFVIAGISVAVAGFLFEQSVALPQRGLSAVLALLALLPCFVIARRLPLELHPFSDQRRFGFFATFAAYLIHGLSSTQTRAFAHALSTGPFAAGTPKTRPDVIVIQSESYFDARRLGTCVCPAPYAQFESAKRESFEQGQLSVPAWGANTMRSEFAMLTGLAPAELGYARFYPYLFVRRACASLAAYFRRGGYRTVAVHPYYADFFGRNRAFGHMHFDRFLDIQNFKSAERVGPYVGDNAVADAVIALLQQSDDKPLFAFAITMENHGPLHLETVVPGEFRGRHTLGEDAQWRDLTAYLRHVESADTMIGRLTGYLRERNRPTVLCFYGDHVPALTSVFDALGAEPINSDYFIWRNFGADSGERCDVRVESLGSAIQRAMSGASSPRTESRNEMRQMPA
jgi:phosphoglycerol transferase MdoB-like AlkP superfamily enzyme